jgi:putative aldouronate transport system substrate-binding protein
MRKFTKAAAMLCAAAMVFPSASVFAAAEDGGASELTEVGTYPISEETLEFTMFRTSMPNVEDFQTNDFTKYMEDLTNIKFTFESASRDDRKEKLNMEFNTDTYPDVIMHYAPDAAKWGVEEGILIQLDDLIYENMPNYVEKMGDYIDQTRQTDGHIYQIAGLNDCYHCMYGRKMWVNTHYLEEMGVDVPETTQEFYDVCKKFVETYPDKIAIGGASSGWYVDFVAWLMGSFTLDSGEYGKIALTPEGKMISAATTDEWREGLRYIKSLYDIGAIYDGNFTQDAEQLRTIMNQEDVPVLFVPFGTISDGIDADANNEVYRQYQCIAPLEGPDGTRLTAYFKYSGLEEGSVSITDHCSNPAAVLRWVDYFFSEKGDISAQFGADEGTDWVWEPNDGSVGLNGEPAMYKIADDKQYSSDVQNHDWQDLVVRYAPADYRLGAATDPDVDLGTTAGLEKLLYLATKEKMEPYGQNPENGDLDVLPSLKFTADEASDLQTIQVEVQNYINSSKVEFITGVKSLDDDWDTYLEELDNCGLQTMIDYYQAAYDRQFGDSAE